MSVSNRISLIMHANGLNQTAFAKRLGIQKSNVSHIISGRSKPGLDLLEKILLEFPKVDAHWLITGRPSSLKQSATDPKENNSSISIDNLIQTIDIEKIILLKSDGSFAEYQSASPSV